MHEDPDVLTEGDIVKEQIERLRRKVDETVDDLDRAHEKIHRRRRTRVPARRRPGRSRGREDTKKIRSTT